MVAIEVKYLPCTHVKGSRIKAICGDKSVTISKPMDTRHGDETYFEAVKALITKHAPFWKGSIWAAGYLEKSGDYVFTYICNQESALGQRLMAEIKRPDSCGGFWAF